MLRKRLSVLVFSLLILSITSGGCGRIVGNILEIGPPENRVVVEKDVMVRMRDGVLLATDVYKPREPGKYPVILTRLPYGKGGMGRAGLVFAQRGYIFVVQDCRACFKSEGDVFIPFATDWEDGMDTVEWIVRQPWYDGNLGTWGASYLGITQWQIAANNPYIKCMYPTITTGRLDMTVHSGGAFHYNLGKGWSSGVGKQNVESSAGMLGMLKDLMPGGLGKKDEEGGYYNKPLMPEFIESWDEIEGMTLEQGLIKAGLMQDVDNPPPDVVYNMLDAMNYPAFSEGSDEFNFKDRYRELTAPMLMLAGWYDIFIGAQLEDYMSIRKTAPEHVAGNTRLIIGPHGHISGTHPDAEKGARMVATIRNLMNVDWYDYWLKGEDNGIMDTAPIRLYVMGKNVWRDEYEWPLARTVYTDYYIHSGGDANTKRGDGTLSTEPTGEGPPDRFKYDPRDPVPTVGGNNLLIPMGAKDQAEVEVRDDVLVFTSAPLEKDLEVTGPIRMILYAASSAKDTDFTAKLCDVYPDGTSLIIQDGIIRARYRESYRAPSLIEPEKVYEYEIGMAATSICFLKGHRIRVQVSSSNFPRFDRNTNAGGEGGIENIIVAEQTVYHDKDNPSRIILPVIP